MNRAFAFLAVLAHVRSADNTSSVSLYLGNGCYWARQHLFIEDFEKGKLNRTDSALTAVTGYAGSNKTGAGGKVCYHNDAGGGTDYAELGHAEVVSLDVPSSFLVDTFSAYFTSFVELSPGVWAREDYADAGPAYRSLVGFSGGVGNHAVFEAMKKANLHNMTLSAGVGSEPDNFLNNTVYVMDSDKFSFVQAELCMQFHDGIGAPYPAKYHNLTWTLKAEGRLHDTGCPPPVVCGYPTPRDVVV